MSQHKISVLIALSSNEGSGETAQMGRVALAFPEQILKLQSRDKNEDSDQNLDL